VNYRGKQDESDKPRYFSIRMLTVVQTLKLQKRPVFEYLKSALRNHRAGDPNPSLLTA